ncbi:MAG: gamma-glutamyl-gamma-aminobutyrate hydrolase family protein, partial [Planctomycetota bacterium]|nr:gamma-glutamyl-gamma-aminobutyrate hydrolase family protein [Planctomycetota bacterium]
SEASDSGAGVSRPRQWPKRVLIALGIIILLALALFGAYRSYRNRLYRTLPEDAPRIGISLDSLWLNQTGLTYSAFDIALPRAGGRLVELDFTAAGDPVDPDRVAKMLDGIDGLILGGGGDVDPRLYSGDPSKSDHANRRYDDFDLELIRQAKARKIPVLGICRGCEILNVAFGGTLKDLQEEPEVRARHFLPLQGHSLHVEAGGRLAGILKQTEFEGVMSTHGHAIDRLGRGVRAVAWADVDRKEIEAIEIAGAGWIIGIMWHPERESLTDEMHLNLFRALVEQARKNR